MLCVFNALDGCVPMIIRNKKSTNVWTTWHYVSTQIDYHFTSFSSSKIHPDKLKIEAIGRTHFFRIVALNLDFFYNWLVGVKNHVKFYVYVKYSVYIIHAVILIVIFLQFGIFFV